MGNRILHARVGGHQRLELVHAGDDVCGSGASEEGEGYRVGHGFGYDGHVLEGEVEEGGDGVDALVVGDAGRLEKNGGCGGGDWVEG